MPIKEVVRKSFEGEEGPYYTCYVAWWVWRYLGAGDFDHGVTHLDGAIGAAGYAVCETAYALGGTEAIHAIYARAAIMPSP